MLVFLVVSFVGLVCVLRRAGEKERGGARSPLPLPHIDRASIIPSTSAPPASSPAFLAARSSFSVAIASASRFALPLGALRAGLAATSNLAPVLGASP